MMAPILVRALANCGRVSRRISVKFLVQTIVMVLCAAVGIASWSINASAATIGASGGAGPSPSSSYSLAGTGWVVDDGSFGSGGPIGLQSVAYDPAAGPWHKKLTGADGGDFAASDTGSGALHTFSVIEYLTVSGTTPWTDWHERIMQPGWRWLDDRASSGEPVINKSGAPVPGLSISFGSPTASEGGSIDFKFDPIAPGTSIQIIKRMVFDGLDPLLPGETFLGKLDVFEHPTVPEPSTEMLTLLSVGLIASTSCSRRWLSRR